MQGIHAETRTIQMLIDDMFRPVRQLRGAQLPGLAQLLELARSTCQELVLGDGALGVEIARGRSQPPEHAQWLGHGW
jgi:hypothetical protein